MGKYYSLHLEMLLNNNEAVILILGRSQLLKFYHHDIIKTYHISTAKKGYGELLDSYKTPRGWHYIRSIIGKNNPKDSCYTGRRLSKESPISGRILWLCGLESHNHHPSKHSMVRYIYIHGVPKAFKKTPTSLGCINMRNSDITELTELLPKYCKVLIHP
jgi:L,D-transpeptidase YbiS